MRDTCLFALLLAGSLLVGCGGRNDQSVLLLERENRHLEDLIWQWKDAYDEQTARLEACQRAARAAQRASDRDTSSTPNPGSASLRARKPAADATEMPKVESPEGELPAPGRLDIPEVTPPSAQGARRKSPSVLVPVGADEEAVDSGEIDTYVTHVVLNEKLTGGIDLDKRKTGDEGVLAVIEPRNAENKYVPLAGAVTVLLVDPKQSGAEAELARWDYDANETVPYLRRSLLGRGIHLELRWPADPPQQERLRLVARYTTADGRKLETFREIVVKLPPASVGRWTPGGRATRELPSAPELSPAGEVEATSFARRTGPLPTPPAPTATIPLEELALVPPENAVEDGSSDFSRGSIPAAPALRGAAEPQPFPPPTADENWKPIR